MRCLIFTTSHTSVSHSKHAVSFLPLHTLGSRSSEASESFCSLHTSYHKVAKHAESFFSLLTSVSQSRAACGVFFLFTLQYHKAAQHAASYFAAVNTSVSRGVFSLPLHTFFTRTCEIKREGGRSLVRLKGREGDPLRD